ncbi:LPS-assembly protein LptD [Shimia aestuarii]|uniref:LPS-assembly protein LptD n=1 Tax=Shimia aestuarii TaxID=254406 RepID=UPI001FB4C5F2|nr:LPS assembly protein LptD [Shimia aestuarii]
MKAALRTLSLAALVGITAPASAQTGDTGGNMVLVADTVYVTGADRLVAQGRVEALQGDVRIRASKIEYDGARNKVTVTGPIYIEQGEIVRVLADYAELDTGFQNALLKSARVVLDQQLQMATTQMSRVEGRYNVLHKAKVSSCRVCEDGEAPLWQIRAQRIVHDQEERQIYFDNAQFRVLDVPIFYFPQLRLPDPTLKRASGFLIPEFHQNSKLGFGIKVPYFLTLGPHRDLTLTPYLGKNTKTLEYRYRQAFRNGGIEVNGAFSDDSIHPNQPRYFLFADGYFTLPNDYRLSFDVKYASDDAYLLDYDYSDYDRLNSNVTVERTRRDEYTRYAVLHVQSLRASEDNNTIPTIMAVAETERRFFPEALGGEARLNLELRSHQRQSTLPIDGPDTDPISGPIVDGRDVQRATASLWWRRNWTHSSGLRTGMTGELVFDGIKTSQDTALEGTESQLTPSFAAHMRYPMARVSANGVTQVLEPVAQIGWSGGDPLIATVANDESTRVEFDEGNLLSLSRFPAGDRRERGATAAVGVNWSRFDPEGWQAHFSLGQVYHRTAHPDFTQSSGLSGTRSNLLVAGQLTTQDGLSLMARGLFDWSGGLSKASARLGWSNRKLWLDASVIWLETDVAENRASRLSEWVLDSRYRLHRNWTALADWRYDVASSQSAAAGIGLEYRNECVKIGLSISRNFTTSATVRPSTDIGLTVALLGFSARSADKSYNRTCRN